MIRARLSLIVGLLAAAAAGAQGVSMLRGHDTNAPVDITSDRIEVQDQANRAIFSGKVHAVQTDMTMDSARMTVAYSKATTPGGDPQIQRIDASGGVVVVSPGEKASGNFGIYDLQRKIITLIGNVALVRDGNTVKGARLVTDLNTGRSTVDGSAVGGTSSQGGRVTGRFTVPQRQQDQAKPAAAPAGK